MNVKDVMTASVVAVGAGESAALAARLLSRRNVGALPVCGDRGRLVGMVTDRDIAVRCVAADRDPRATAVGEIMTRRVVSVEPETDARAAAQLMRAEQVRRLPVTSRGKVVGMVSLADLAGQPACAADATACLTGISDSIRRT